MLTTLFGRAAAMTLPAALAMAGLSIAVAPARAQAIIMSVNGAPITSYDVGQRMKLLRLLKKPATNQAALDDLIADKIKLDEVSKFTITLAASDIVAQGAIDATEAKIPPAVFAQELQRSGIDETHWHEHFKAEAEWGYYVKALNKTLDVSNDEVRAEMAKRGQSASVTEYVLRQVVVIVPNANGVEQKIREAQQLRAGFSSCDSGVTFARGLPDVVVQEPVTRTSAAVGEQVRTLLDKTPIGHLTAPERSPNGLEMLALCSKKAIHDDSAADATIRNKLLSDRLKGASESLYAKVRSRAVIVRR